MSEMHALLADYLRLRRGLGHKLATTEAHLRKFVAVLDEDGIDTITIEAAIKFVSDPAFGPESVVPTQRLAAIRGFARYVSAIDPECPVPPAGLVRYRARRRTPHVFTDAEIEALIDRARRSTPFPFRALTLDTMIRLLTVTGMRVGEVIRMDCADVDFDAAVLKVRDSKFRKGRDVPVSDSTIQALQRYRSARDLRGNLRTSCFFVSLKGKPIIYNDFQATFRQAVTAADIGSHRSSRPHIHDLRHRFAILTVTAWYRDGLDVEALLPRLSTYLGHREPRFTYWYLTATPDLLGQAAARLEKTHAQRQGAS